MRKNEPDTRFGIERRELGRHADPHADAEHEGFLDAEMLEQQFGVLREDGEVKAYGTGLLSSAGELDEMCKARLRPFDLEAASSEDYDPTHFQPVLFCADSFDDMYRELKEFLLSW